MGSIGVPSRANHFQEPKITDSVYTPQGKWLQVSVDHHITQNLNGGQAIVFNLPQIEQAAFNLDDTWIKFKLRIVRANGQAPAAGDLVYPANGIAQTMWKNIQLFANNVQISKTFAPYNYKAIIEHLLRSSKENEPADKLWGYKKRPAPVGDIVVPANDHEISELDRDTMRNAAHFTEDNPPLHEGWQEFLMKPCIDFFETDANLLCLKNVNWQLRMTPHESKHCLNWAVNHGTEANPADGVAPSIAENYKLQIHPESVKMFVRTEILSDDAYLAAMQAGQMQGFKYTYTPTAIRTKTLSAGHTSIEMSNLAPRSNPIFMAHTFVDHEAYNGNKQRNPYLFRAPPSLAKMYNYKDGQVLQEQAPVDLQDPHGRGRAHLYLNNLLALGISPNTPGLSYDHTELDKGFFFKIISLAPSGNSMDLAPMTSQGTLNYRFELSEGADRNYETLTYMRFEEEQVIVHIDGTIINTFEG